MAAPLTRAEKVELFWKSSAPETLAKMGCAYRAFFHKLEPLELVTTNPVGNEVTIKVPPPEEITFYLEGHSFGRDEIWIAVTCGGEVIVAPFPLSHREHLPLMAPVSAELEAINLC